MAGDDSTILSRRLNDCDLTWRRYSITFESEHILDSFKFPQMQLTLTWKEYKTLTLMSFGNLIIQ